MDKQYWLMKTEPDVFSFSDLKKMPGKKDHWDGIRNYQARNFMRDQMKVGDTVLFYHSNAKPPGVIGVAKVNSKPYPDHTAFDKKSKYFDSKSDPENPRWVMVDIKYVKDFKNFVSLDELKSEKRLKDMKVVQRGQRLSIQPVTKKEFEIVCELGGINPID